MMTKEKKIIFIFFSIIIFFCSLLIFDLRISSDSKTFMRVANDINSFLSIFSASVQEEPQYIMSYLIFKFLMLFSNFEIAFKIFNFSAFILIVLYTNKIQSHFGLNLHKKVDYIFFLLLFFFNLEILQWVNYALTDLILVAMMMMSIFYFLKQKLLISYIILALAILIKPQSLFIILILSFIFINKKFNNKFLFFLLYFIFYILVFILTYFAQKNDLDFLITNITYKIFFTKLINGNIVDDRYYIEYDNFFSIFKIYFLRLINIFSIYFDQYSTKHKIYKVVYFTMLYTPIFLYLMRKKTFNQKLLKFSLSNLLIILTFIIITFIDYDLRYRIYFYPFIIMISSFCFSYFYENREKK